MNVLPAAKLVRVQECVDPDCTDPAEVIVAPHVAYCGTHALRWYLAERVPS